jgi:hypothetical protein
MKNQKYKKENFIYECKNENINLLDQCKGENGFLDMVIDIHNLLSSKLTNIHNSIRNEMLIKFNLNDLHIKAFYEFMVDLLFSNFKEKLYIYIYIYIGGVAGRGKCQNIKAVSAYFKKKHSHDMFKVSVFTASVASLIGGSTIHSLIGLSIDGNIDSQI